MKTGESGRETFSPDREREMKGGELVFLPVWGQKTESGVLLLLLLFVSALCRQRCERPGEQNKERKKRRRRKDGENRGEEACGKLSPDWRADTFDRQVRVPPPSDVTTAEEDTTIQNAEIKIIIKLNWKGEKQNKMNLKWQKNITRESKLKRIPKIKK